MATSKVLQKPEIIEIIGSTIRVKHPDISKNIRSRLTATIAAGGTTATVADNNKFADDDWFIIGEIGDPRTEEGDVNQANAAGTGYVARGTSITVTNSLDFAHNIDDPITKILERGVKIYGAATDGGAGTLIVSVDAITSPIADAISIQWNKQYTEYTLLSTDTSYAFYYVTFTDGTTDSSASDYIASSGISTSSVEYFIQQALDITGAKLDDQYITRARCIRWANECQNEIRFFSYVDNNTGKLINMDWDFEIIENTTSLTATTNLVNYNLSSLSALSKYGDTGRGIIRIRIGGKTPLIPISIQEYDDLLVGTKSTQLSVAATAGVTTLTVDSNVEFSTSGTLYVGSDTVTYTGKSGTTGFTGIPASGTGSITTTQAIDTWVWQGISPALPVKYTIYDGVIKLDVPIHSDYNNYPIKVRYYKQLTALAEVSDTTEITFPDVFQYYLAAKIEERRQNTQKSKEYMNDFRNKVINNAIRNYSPHLDTQKYYTFIDT